VHENSNTGPQGAQEVPPQVLGMAITPIEGGEPLLFNDVLMEKVKIEEGFLWMYFQDGTMHLLNTSTISEIVAVPGGYRETGEEPPE